MRALNSRRPQPTSTFLSLVPRSCLCLLLLLFVVDGGGARSVTRDERAPLLEPGVKLSAVESDPSASLASSKSGSAAEQVPENLAEDRTDAAQDEKVEPEETGSLQGKVSQPEAGDQPLQAGEDNAEQLADRSPGRNVASDVRKIDLEKQETRKVDQETNVGIEDPGSEILKQEDEDAAVAKKRRRNDVALKPEVRDNARIPVERIEEPKDEGIRRFDGQVDVDGAVPYQENVPDVAINDAGARQLADPGQNTEEWVGVAPKEVEPSAEVLKTEDPREHLPGFLCKTGPIEADQEKENVAAEDETNKNRGHRYLDDAQSKSRRKSSTVYLSAEEKKIPDGEQQSIVEGQIKKLISIRDDALDAQKVDNLDEAKVLTSKRQAGLDEATITQENVRLEQETKVKATNPFHSRQVLGIFTPYKKWKDRAVALQDQIRDKTPVFRLREQAAELLPELPKFTENQLLNALEQVLSSKKVESSSTSYLGNTKDLGLTDVQLRILRCAEQLLEVRERQSFATNVVECIRGLSAINCIRIFVWPVLANYLPDYGTLPIEINVFDLFQGNKQKSGRAQSIHRVKLITPESIVYNILQDALETYPIDQTLVSYVDPKNETLKDLLTSDQLHILLMAEKLLPQALRQEYSNSMFSCVRRFEYFSCIKYFAWPMIKQYFPALPAFPDYQNWYPIYDLYPQYPQYPQYPEYPQYPIVPFPIMGGDVGELPEVVDADATRSRRPKPEATIIQVLQNTLKEQPRLSTSPSFIDQSADSYIALIPQDQLLSISMAEQLIPVAYRSQFVQKTVQCMKEFNYLACIKYSTWPTVRQFIPNFPDISGILPDFQLPEWSDIVNYIPILPNIPVFGSHWPFGGSSEQPEPPEPPEYVLLKDRPDTLQSSNELEAKILNVLLDVQSSISRSPEISPFVLTGNVVMFARFTRPQLDILRLSESLIPSIARPGLVTEVIVYLQRSDNFIDCARYVIWPTLTRYVTNLPAFPSLESKEPIGAAQAAPESKEPSANPGEKLQERVISQGDGEKVIANRFQLEESRNKVQQNVPVISVTGTRFVPIFTEHPESVILNIVRSVQLQSLNLNRGTASPSTLKSQQFIDLLNEQQVNIVNIVDGLLPESVRNEFANKLIACLRVNNFLICTRDVIWPTLSGYFPWLPSFPNFGSITNPPSSEPSPGDSTKHNLTESSSNTDAPPLSETDVTTGQHGDTKVTITDTRFVPIFNELPETVILNILKAVQLSLPNLPAPSAPARTQDFQKILTEQQANILSIAESLLPVSTRASYLDRLRSCLSDKVFLQCVRDVTWPTIAQTYPWLPSFPNFGGYQSIPRIRLQMFLTEKSQGSNIEALPSQENLKLEGVALEKVEERIERILVDALNRDSNLKRSFLDVSNPSLSHLTRRQQNIVKLAELGIPEEERATYIARIEKCTKEYDFVGCTQNITWPTVQRNRPGFVVDFFEIFKSPEDRPISVSPFPPPDLPSNIRPIPGFAELPAALSQGIPQPALTLQVSGQASQVSAGAQLFPTEGSSAFTPSVGNKGAVPGYAGQPPGIFVDISKERVQLADIVQLSAAAKESGAKNRERRSVDVTKTYYETVETPDSWESSAGFPNTSESEYLQLLIKMRESAETLGKPRSEPKSYFADTLNVTVRSALSADQYEIIKIVEDVDPVQGRGIAQQVVNCIAGLSFIRCIGIFVWPLIVSQFPALGFLGRGITTENQVQEFFGMSTIDFEKEMLQRKDSIEQYLLDWYKQVAEEKFQTNLGFLKVKGYGNGELGISFSGFREGRGAKLKDNKNLPSILTIISDIMEEVLDQRPETEKPRRDKEKKEKSIDISREGEIQFLKDTEEYVDIMRSMNDDEIITMFLDKIRANDTEPEGDDSKFFGLEDAYNAFEVLFGPRLHGRLAHKLQTFNHKLRNLEETPPEENKEVDILSLATLNAEELKLLPLNSQISQETYNLEKEASRDQEQRQRQKRAKNFFKSFLDKHSSKHLKELVEERLEEIEDNKIADDRLEKDKKSVLMVKLPRLDEEFLPKKMTSSIVHLGRAMKNKMMQMMPGLGLIFSFLLQTAVAHAKAAASMAGMISNMAMGSAIIGMIRDSFFGANTHPQIKYVYDNHKVGPGITWPTNSHYRRL